MVAPIALIGGTGFVGRHIASELARKRLPLRVLTRRRERNRDLLVIPTLELVEVDVHSAAELSQALGGCSSVVNLAGILHAQNDTRHSFQSVHGTLPAKVADAARFAGISRVLHVSALGASAQAPSEYLRTKAAGEAALRDARDLALTVLRPSVIFGPDDDFFNRFAALLRLSPWLFPLACAEARFQPVYVGDVARALIHCLEHDETIGLTLELGGPRQYALRELVQFTARCLGLKRYVIGLPDGLSRFSAALLGLAPRPVMTMDNYLSMQVANVCHDNGFERIGLTPSSVESVVPGYVGRRGREALYTELRTHAGRD